MSKYAYKSRCDEHKRYQKCHGWVLPWHCRCCSGMEEVNPTSLDLVAFTLIIDDIVFSDGRTCMGQLGGGGSQTLFGFLSFSGPSGRVGLAAEVGPDIPDSILEWFSTNNIDMDGIIIESDTNSSRDAHIRFLNEKPATPRAWQIVEDDGRRHEIWRTPQTQRQAEMLLPRLRTLPEKYLHSKAYHLGIHPEHPNLELLEDIRANMDGHHRKGLLSIETFTCADQPIPSKELAFLELVDVFSPNESEASSMLGIRGISKNDGQAASLVLPFIDQGVRYVAVRRAHNGAIVCDAVQRQIWKIGAYENAHVVDTTGAGNAFCGALIAALQAGLSIEEAGMYGCAAGSIMVEAEGIPVSPAVTFVNELRKRSEKISVTQLKL